MAEVSEFARKGSKYRRERGGCREQAPEHVGAGRDSSHERWWHYPKRRGVRRDASFFVRWESGWSGSGSRWVCRIELSYLSSWFIWEPEGNPWESLQRPGKGGLPAAAKLPGGDTDYRTWGRRENDLRWKQLAWTGPTPGVLPLAADPRLPAFPPEASLCPSLCLSQYSQGGPIIAVQVENEYGSFDKDKGYMPYVQKVRSTSRVSIFACFLPQQASAVWPWLRHRGYEIKFSFFVNLHCGRCDQDVLK